MNKNKKLRYSMTEDELKSLKKSLEYVKKLDIFNDRFKNENKEKNLKKVA